MDFSLSILKSENESERKRKEKENTNLEDKKLSLRKENTRWREKIENGNGGKVDSRWTYCGVDESRDARKNFQQEWS